MKNILVISPSEICYHPRLVKAVDFYLQKGCTVTIVNTITGSAPVKIYREFYSNRLVGCIELNIDKRSKKSKIRWAFNSMLQLLLIKNWKYLHIPILFPYILNKGLIGISNIKGDYDVIHINLVDTLPLASKIKRKQKNKAALIYDSQEYFTGQYAKYAKEKYNWVAKAEKQYLKDTDIILGTTNVMVEKIQGKYHVVQPIIRVRNIPSGNEIRTITENKSTCLTLVWHGMSINYDNCRGVHILVRAIAKCKTNIKLYLQGNKSYPDFNILQKEIEDLGIKDKIIIKDPVKPDDIVGSISRYDIGLAGELPEEENQLYTSSNKLFEYIKAGLAVIVPDLPGLRETIDEYGIGLLYEAGNTEELANKIDYLNQNREKLMEFKMNSLKSAVALSWETDYQPVWNKIVEKLG